MAARHGNRSVYDALSYKEEPQYSSPLRPSADGGQGLQVGKTTSGEKEIYSGTGHLAEISRWTGLTRDNPRHALGARVHSEHLPSIIEVQVPGLYGTVHMLPIATDFASSWRGGSDVVSQV